MWSDSWCALRQGEKKLITSPAGEKSRAMLFDLAADPGEKTDIATRDPATARRLLADMDLILKAASSRSPTQPLNLTDRERDRLCALGYIECGG